VETGRGRARASLHPTEEGSFEVLARVKSKLVLIVVIPGLALAMIVRDDLVSLEATVAECATVQRVVDFAQAAGVLVHELQKERRALGRVPGREGNRIPGGTRAQREQTDEAWRFSRPNSGTSAGRKSMHP